MDNAAAHDPHDPRGATTVTEGEDKVPWRDKPRRGSEPANPR